MKNVAELSSKRPSLRSDVFQGRACRKLYMQLPRNKFLGTNKRIDVRNHMRQSNSNKKEKIQIVLIILCTLVFLGCAVWLVMYLLDAGKGAKQADSLKNEYILVEGEAVEEDTTKQDNPNDGNTKSEAKDKVVIDGREYDDFSDLDVTVRKIDFDAMQKEVNEDIYAWIYVPGTKVDYPILQRATNNNFYLDHDVNGKKASCGSIYTEKHNHKDFNDNHTVIYGHNMKNGTMFKTLRNYDDKDFFEENKYIYIYTETDTRVYEIFGAYEYTDEHLLLNYNTKNAGEFQKYLETIKKQPDASGHFNREMLVNSNDKIITLSICIAGKDGSRYLVQGKLIAIETN